MANETVERRIAGPRKMADYNGERRISWAGEEGGRDWERRTAGRGKMADETEYRRITYIHLANGL